MFSMMIFMAIASTAVEMMIVYHSNWMYQTARKYFFFGLIFSIVISVALGYMFGMQGMIVGGAAVLSTMMSAIIYSLHLLELFRVMMKGIGDMKVATINTIHKARDSYEDVRNTAIVVKTKTTRTYNTVRHPINTLKRG